MIYNTRNPIPYQTDPTFDFDAEIPNDGQNHTGTILGHEVTINDFSFNSIMILFPKETGDYTFSLSNVKGNAALLISADQSYYCCSTWGTQDQVYSHVLLAYLPDQGFDIPEITVNLVEGMNYVFNLVYVNDEGSASMTLTYTDPSGVTHTNFDEIGQYITGGNCQYYYAFSKVTSTWTGSYTTTYATFITTYTSDSKTNVDTIYYIQVPSSTSFVASSTEYSSSTLELSSSEIITSSSEIETSSSEESGTSSGVTVSFTEPSTTSSEIVTSDKSVSSSTTDLESSIVSSTISSNSASNTVISISSSSIPSLDILSSSFSSSVDDLSSTFGTSQNTESYYSSSVQTNLVSSEQGSSSADLSVSTPATFSDSTTTSSSATVSTAPANSTSSEISKPSSMSFNSSPSSHFDSSSVSRNSDFLSYTETEDFNGDTKTSTVISIVTTTTSEFCSTFVSDHVEYIPTIYLTSYTTTMTITSCQGNICHETGNHNQNEPPSNAAIETQQSGKITTHYSTVATGNTAETTSQTVNPVIVQSSLQQGATSHSFDAFLNKSYTFTVSTFVIFISSVLSIFFFY